MSLDRQKILHELGSVMNQLKSADCGCMGKLFSNQSQGEGAAMGTPLPTCGGCRRGCCHGHGYMSHGAPCAGEPYSTGQMNHSMNGPCMGRCNPPKLYADTYSYLNNNLMQPVVKEVYNDLKSISPANTIMNNSLANQMGLSQGNPIQENAGNPMQNMSGMGSANMNMGQSQPPVNPIGGMGPQIVNMIMGESGMKPSNIQGMPGQGQSSGPMANTSQSSPGQVGAMNMPGVSHGQYSANMGNANLQGNMAGFADPATQYVSKENMYSMGNAQNSPVSANMSQGGAHQMGNMNNAMVSGNAYNIGNNSPAVQQMQTNMPQYGQTQGMMQNVKPGAQQMPTGNQAQYGQHTQGVMKFNEMFPGVMQGGDLGFDPMKIAIQMNPANQQKAAMDTIQRLMTGGPANNLKDTAGNSDFMKPLMEATKTAVQSVNPAPASQGQQNFSYSNQLANQQVHGQTPESNLTPAPTMNQQMITPGQQQAVYPNTGAQQPHSMPQQQVYTAVSGQPMLNQQQYQQQQMQSYQQVPDAQKQYQQQQNQLYIDPNTGATMPPNSPGQEGIVDSNGQQPPIEGVPQTNLQPQEGMIKEPIFPADTSRNRPMTYSKPQQKYYQYNTLGQPVEMLPAKMFHPPEPSLPQTLSPQPPPTKLRNDYLRYSNVKSTVSKTSLAGNKPVGRTPSRSQLQHIYNQYKGSQSYTQQNVRAPASGGTFSEGKLNIPPTNANPPQLVPVERVGGDTVANNQMANSQIPNKVQQVMGQIGDVPGANKPQGDGAPLKAPGSPIPARQAKLRNGLQDVVYTSYPSSAAWSFHGTNTYRPVSVGYRFRNFK